MVFCSPEFALKSGYTLAHKGGVALAVKCANTLVRKVVPNAPAAAPFRNRRHLPPRSKSTGARWDRAPPEK